MATDEKKQTIRDKVQRESLELGKKQRFGMFSIPISNAIGDNSYDQVKTFKKGPEPRNFTTNFAKKGQIDTVLFSKPDYITIGDPYQEPLKQQMKGSKSTANIKGVHQFNFQPAKTFQRKVKSDYEYIPEYNENTKSRRMPGGVVVLEPKNFMTSPPKRGQVGKQTTFSGQIEYLPDPYDNKRQLEKIERLQHLKKIPHKPFTQKVIGKETFSTIQDTYGGNFPLSPEKIQRQSKFEVKHDVPFMPSNYPKKGYNKTIGKFPEYKEDPIIEVNRKRQSVNEQAHWKPTQNSWAVTSPSIKSQNKNQNNELPSIFRLGNAQ
eukprot:403335648